MIVMLKLKGFWFRNHYSIKSFKNVAKTTLKFVQNVYNINIAYFFDNRILFL